MNNDLSNSQVSENLTDCFCSISQEFPPICPEEFPPWIKDELKPVLEEWHILKQIMGARKPESTVPGDSNVKIVKEFVPEIAKPATIIFNYLCNSDMEMSKVSRNQKLVH